MNKRVKGGMPQPAPVTFHGYDPLHGEAPPAHHERDNIASGNLRHHNGAVGVDLPGNAKSGVGRKQ